MPDEAVCCAPSDRPVLSDGEAARFANLFRALSDPTRVKIVRLLASAPELCVCDINANFPLEPSTMSHHLHVLGGAGLIAGHKRGRWIFYRLQAEALMVLREFAA